jgi:hypothetical protein
MRMVRIILGIATVGVATTVSTLPPGGATVAASEFNFIHRNIENSGIMAAFDCEEYLRNNSVSTTRTVVRACYYGSLGDFDLCAVLLVNYDVPR